MPPMMPPDAPSTVHVLAEVSGGGLLCLKRRRHLQSCANIIPKAFVISSADITAPPLSPACFKRESEDDVVIGGDPFILTLLLVKKA